MKRVLYILMLLLIFSCSENKEESLYTDYILRYEELTEHTENAMQEAYAESEKQATDLLWGNPLKVEPWLKMIRDINQRSDSLYDQIKKSKDIILIHHKTKPENIQKLKGSSTNIELLRMHRIKEDWALYRTYLDSSVTKIHGHEFLDDRIKDILDTDKLFEVPVLKEVKANSLKLYAYLSMIQYRVRLIESKVTSAMHSQFDAASGYRFVNTSVFVVPESKELYVGDTYKAEIFYAATDTTSAPLIMIGEEILETKYGKAFLKKHITAKDTGKVSEHGKIITIKGYSGDTANIPFTIEYTVIK